MLDFQSAFYLAMVVSIVVAFWLEAMIPLESARPDFQHIIRNFFLWLLAFSAADYAVGYYWLDFPSMLAQQSFGIFYWLRMNDGWLLIALGVLLMDAADYVFHRLCHRIGFLWRFHVVHHTDLRLDVSTTLRFHPIDMVLGNFCKVGFALLFGIPIWVVAFREVFIWPLVFLQHANVSLPPKLEAALGSALITPSIHRLHHSTKRVEHDSNYGNGLVIWDKLFGSFTLPPSPRPADYGIDARSGEKYQTLGGMLLTPFWVGHNERGTSQRGAS